MGGLEEKPKQEEKPVQKEPEDAEEEPKRPDFVGIPRSTKAEKAQVAPPAPRKGKAGDVDPETIAIGVSVAFEVPAIICQLITPLQGGHPWWSKSPDEVSPVAVPLTDVINGMSPKVKKAIKENTALAAVLVGIASLVQEPIAMEIALHREIKIAREQVLQGRLPTPRASTNGGVKGNNQRPSHGLEAARQFNAPIGSEENEGDFSF